MVKDGAESGGMGNQKLGHLETHLMDEHQSQTVLMIFCYACRQKLSIAVLWEALPSSKRKQFKYLQPNDRQGLETLLEVLGEGRATVSNNVDLWELSETEALIKEHSQTGARYIPDTYAADILLSICHMVGSPTTVMGLKYFGGWGYDNFISSINTVQFMCT